ncbi:ALBINO3-like protein 2, chloroplastic isoform X1 [Rosa rugosa]|uniref:ALBINO3-like protein 2, chloroplastic isoform X1 n=1 Tax=Rosa rugosa TaxID=74645 RepID=UPI002B416ED4|nr:ALBINO3-like protein 2, chloroplastic isoform X1 [Rosa rugosa]
MASSSYYLRRRSASLVLRALSHPPARQFHLLENPNLLSPHVPLTRSRSSSAYSFAPTRTLTLTLTLTHSLCLDLDRLAGVDSAATLSAVLNSGGAEGSLQHLRPIQDLISVLDWFHQLTGLPWWLVIVSSSLAMRIALLPILIVQLKRLKRIEPFLPRLPPPGSSCYSAKSYFRRISLFEKRRREIGCPSFLWLIAIPIVRALCFSLWFRSIREMSLSNHPGFDCGGTLWFQNLTELPRDVLSCIFPLMIAGLHYSYIQICFKPSSGRKFMFGLLSEEEFKFQLKALTLPIYLFCYFVPQGCLVYWVTSNSLNIIQALALADPRVCAKLGLPDKNHSKETSSCEELDNSRLSPLVSPMESKKISPQIPSPRDLSNLSIKLLSEGHKERALHLLKIALEKDPEYIRALILMGQTLLQKKLNAEATEYFERAITKIFIAGHPTKVEDIDNLIVASQWAGSAYIRQGKMEEGIVHLERIAQLEEPDEPKSKAHYFDGLLMLASALSNVGRKDEALKHLRLAAAYNPAYKEYLEQCKNMDDSVVSGNRKVQQDRRKLGNKKKDKKTKNC